jgi:hypothetical protein
MNNRHDWPGFGGAIILAVVSWLAIFAAARWLGWL